MNINFHPWLDSVNFVFLFFHRHSNYISFRCFKVGSILNMSYKMHVSQRVRLEWLEAHGKCFSQFRMEPLPLSCVRVWRVCVPLSLQQTGAPPRFRMGTFQLPCWSASVYTWILPLDGCLVLAAHLSSWWECPGAMLLPPTMLLSGKGDAWPPGGACLRHLVAGTRRWQQCWGGREEDRRNWRGRDLWTDLCTALECSCLHCSQLSKERWPMKL